MIDGGAKLISDLHREAVTSSAVAGAILETHARSVARRWKASVPVRSGRLRESIQVEREMGAFANPTVEVYSDWFVARFREHGTVHQPPRGEAGAALDAEVPLILKSMRSVPRL